MLASSLGNPLRAFAYFAVKKKLKTIHRKERQERKDHAKSGTQDITFSKYRLTSSFAI